MLKHLDFCRGAIVTERHTIDNFANKFGLDFLEGFLDQGRPVGELMHQLRLEHAPLGLSTVLTALLRSVSSVPKHWHKLLLRSTSRPLPLG